MSWRSGLLGLVLGIGGSFLFTYSIAECGVSQRFANVLINVNSSTTSGNKVAEVGEKPLTVPQELQGVPWCRQAESKVQDGEYPACLVPPSKEIYRLARPTLKWYGQEGQDAAVWPLLEQVAKGFFIESGASVGERFSNTLAMEKTGNWTGLLVEPDPWNHELIAMLHRKAYLFKGCLSGTQNKETLWFRADRDPIHKNLGMDGHLVDKIPDNLLKDAAIAVTCLPLKNILESIGELHVDFWSLDIEGAEAPVLEATDFSAVKMGVVLIETNKGKQNTERIKNTMLKNGFQIWKVLRFDHIFVHPGYIREKGWKIPADDTRLADIMKM